MYLARRTPSLSILSNERIHRSYFSRVSVREMRTSATEREGEREKTRRILRTPRDAGGQRDVVRKTRARGRRNGAPGTRCHPIIAFALPFHAAEWQKRVPRFSCGRLTTPGDISCRPSRSRAPTRAGAIRQRRHNYLYCATSHLYIAYQVSANEEKEREREIFFNTH